MGAAKCLPGDQRLGQQDIKFRLDFDKMAKVPKLGYFCVVGNAILVSFEIKAYGDTGPFTVELVQQQQNGKDEVINSVIIDPSRGPRQSIVFSENTRKIAGTRCFLRFIATDSQVVIEEGKVRSV